MRGREGAGRRGLSKFCYLLFSLSLSLFVFSCFVVFDFYLFSLDFLEGADGGGGVLMIWLSLFDYDHLFILFVQRENVS